MSTPTVQCPHCLVRTPAVEPDGSPVVCPGCQREFVPDAEPPPSPPKPPVRMAQAIPVPAAGGTPPAPPPAPDKPARPVATPVSRRAERSDDPPRSRTRNRQWDEDEEPAKKRSVLPLVMIGVVLAAGIVLGGGGAAVVLLYLSPQQAKLTASAPPSAQAPDPAKLPRGNWNDPEEFLVLKPEPKKPGGDFSTGPAPGEVEPPKGVPNEDPTPAIPRRGRGNPPDVDPLDPKPIAPKPAADETEIKLPGTVADTCSGGGGRFFILHLSGKKQLAVFDVTQAKVVKYIPLTSDTVKFAAGQDKLIVVYPDDNVLARYDLTTFEKETTAKSPVAGTILSICMGAASSGPLLVSAGDATKFAFLDPLTFQPAGIELGGKRDVGMSGIASAKMHFRASPDGTLFGAWSGSLTPSGLDSVIVRGKKATSKYEHAMVGHAVPGADGRLYTSSGLYTAELKKVSKQPGADQRGRASYLPAVDGNLFLQVITQVRRIPGGHADEVTQAEVRMDGDDRTLFTFKDLSPFVTDARPGGDLTTDKRVHFHPSAHLLVTVPLTNDRLLLRKFDLEAAFDASGVDYLYVTSRPPAAVPGKAYEYQIVVRSKKGGVKYKLDAGPKGLTVSDTGKVTWTAPDAFSSREQVIITISDASKQEIFHTFEVVPGELKGAVPGAEKPAAPPDPPAKGGDDVALGGAADYACFAGGGRFILLRILLKREVAVFDTTERKVVKTLPLAEPGTLVAGGRGVAVLVNPRAGEVVRWNLTTFEKDTPTKLPVGFAPVLAVMGHASDGPLFLGAGKRLGANRRKTKESGFFDPHTLTRLSYKGADLSQPHNLPDEWHPNSLHCSPDGRVWAWWDPGSSPTGLNSLILEDGSADVTRSHISAWTTLVGADGSLFTGGGVFSADQSKVHDAHDKAVQVEPGARRGISPAPSSSDFQSFGRTAVPSATGPFYLWFPPSPNRFNHPDKAEPAVKMLGGKEPIAELKDLRGLVEPKANPNSPVPGGGVQTSKVPFDRRVFFLPAANLLAVLSPDGTTLHLHEVKIRDLLDKSGQDYLLVLGGPPPAERGKKWAYTPDVWSKKGGVKAEVVSGPPGLKADGAGVTWDVPADHAGTVTKVELKLSDSSGKNVPHAFTVTPAGPPTGTKPAEPKK